MSDPAHQCHAKGCHFVIPPKSLMCPRHWAMVPISLKRMVWSHYVPGQEIRKDPSQDFIVWASRAIESVAAAEAGPRARYELRRVNNEKQCYTFVHDVGRYAEACLFADAAVRMLGGDFIVYDSQETRILYDSRTMRSKFAPEADTLKDNGRQPREG